MELGAAGENMKKLREIARAHIEKAAAGDMQPSRIWLKPALTPAITLGSTTPTNTIGTVRVACCITPTVGLPAATMTFGARASNSATSFRMRSGLLEPPARTSIRTLRPSDQPNCCNSCRNAAIRSRNTASVSAIPVRTAMRRTRSPGCCARRERLGRSRATAEDRDELASLHSITSSARASSLGGTVRPRAFAYFVGACTGRSAGFSPLRMRSTYAADRRTISAVSGP
jgi:hypothetical protein